jgi:hypothetical protein
MLEPAAMEINAKKLAARGRGQGVELTGVLRKEVHAAFMLVCVGWGVMPGRTALV